MTRQEAFRILELPDSADKTQIRHAYSEKVKIYHVETHPKEFARLHEAYRTALKTGFSSAPEHAADLTDIPPREPHSSQDILSNTRTRPPKSPYAEILDSLVRENPSDAQAWPPESPYKEILDSLVKENPFSIPQCLEVTQLICYKYRYQQSPAPSENLPDDNQMFLQIPWRDWKDSEWLLLICHPDFIGRQYSYAFQTELLDFLEEENRKHPGGIGQEFFFTLCTAYGFFLSGQEEEPQSALLQAIMDLLSAHPRHRDYSRDLRQWKDLQANRRLVLFCQEAVRFSQGKSPLADKEPFKKDFLDRAERLLMDEFTPQNEFILHNLIRLPDALFSQDLSERKRSFQHMQRTLFDEFTTAFDPTGENHSLSDKNYIPLSRRLSDLKARYLPQDYWSRVIRSSCFMQSLQNWLKPQGGLSLQYYFPYDVWREIRCLFDGGAPFRKSHLVWLQTEGYFPEYEKRYQQEALWRRQHIEDAYFQETFPLPRRSLKKNQLLFTVRRGTSVGIGEMPSILKGLYRHDEGSLRFFERLTTAMAHFNFLLIAPAYEKDPVPDDVICFLKDKVILYRRKENLTCHLSHAVFHDHLARAMDSLAQCYCYKEYKQSLYSEKFINTCCKNMYYHDCYIRSIYQAGDP